MAKRGRKKLITPADWLRAVKKLNTMDDEPISVFLKVSRPSVYRFRVDPENKPVVEEGRAYLDSLKEMNLTPNRLTWESFQTAPTIKSWKAAMDRRMVSQDKQRAWMRTLFNLCKHLHVVPSKLTLDMAAEVNLQQRNAYYADLPQIKGLAYSRIREAIRGFFMSVHQISAQALTDAGVGKEALKGQGRYARQKVAQPIRHAFEKNMIEAMNFANDSSSYEKFQDALGNSIFCFGTGTRVSASLEFGFHESDFNLQPNKWMFEIWDKGSRGKKKRWEKIIMGNVLKKFKEWASDRYKIPFEDLEKELPRKINHLFPSFIDDKMATRDDWLRTITKPMLIKSGLPYREFPPTHIWRHTFAQDMLWATDWNYELVASIGGWVNTMILKKHYGQMSEAAREKGLLKAMGEEVPEEKRFFEW